MQVLPFEDKIIAHRGASLQCPENTMAAFNCAFQNGAKVIEFDVMLTKDAVPIVIHDENLRRTTNARGKVANFTFAEIEKLDAGSWFSKKFHGERIPSLAQVIEFMLFVDLQANIEIKAQPENIEATVTAVLSLLNQEWPRNKTLPLISSSDYKTLSILRDLAPEVQLGIVMDSWRSDWQRDANDLGLTSIHLSKKIANKSN